MFLMFKGHSKQYQLAGGDDCSDKMDYKMSYSC